MGLWVLLHGFGVRGKFWDLVQNSLPGPLVTAPSFDHADIETALAAIRRTLVEASDQGPVHVVGHSLGGVLGAVAAATLPATVVASVAVVSSPWEVQGNRGGLPAVARFMLKRGWLPGFVVRRRFFGPSIPAKSQKALFRTAVPEASGLRDVVGRRPWFHINSIQGAYPHPLLVFGSEADRIVSAQESRAMAQAWGGKQIILPRERGWGHDDPAVDPRAARELAEILKAFTASVGGGGSHGSGWPGPGSPRFDNAEGSETNTPGRGRPQRRPSGQGEIHGPPGEPTPGAPPGHTSDKGMVELPRFPDQGPPSTSPRGRSQHGRPLQESTPPPP